ncbi:MAG TPA: class I SAM-dependent methyltransferase [Candidatus Bathyarchaeia archaeon]
MNDAGYVYETFVEGGLRNRELSRRKILYYARVGRIKRGNALVIGFAMPDELETLQERGHRVVGIDRDAYAVRVARKKGCEAVMYDVDGGHLPFRDSCFDSVFAIHIIEHLVHSDTFVGEIHRILKPGGIAVIETPDYEFWGPRRFYVDKTHTTPFTKSSLRKTLRCKFDLIRIRRMCPPFILWRFTYLMFGLVNPLNMQRVSLACIARKRRLDELTGTTEQRSAG